MEFLRRLQYKAVELVDSAHPHAKQPVTSNDHADGAAKLMSQMEILAKEPLSNQMQESVTSLMQKKSVDFLQRHSTLLPRQKDEIKFIYLGEKVATVRLYDAVHEKKYIVKAKTTLPASVFDIMSVLQLQGDLFSRTMHEVFGVYFDQGKTLHAPHDKPPPESTKVEDICDLDGVGVHWMVLKTSRAMGQEGVRDAVFASYSQMYETESADDEDIINPSVSLSATRRNSPLVSCGTYIWESIDVPALAPFSPTVTGRRRFAFRNSGIYVEKVPTPTHADLTSVSLVLSFDMDGTMDRRKCRRWMQRLALSVLNISRMARHGARSIVPKHKWLLDPQCIHCKQPFHLFRRRHHCRLCGHAVCSACSCSMDVEFPVLPDGRILPHATVRGCTKCAFVGATMQRVPAAAILDDLTISRTTSLWSNGPMSVRSKDGFGSWRNSNDLVSPSTTPRMYRRRTMTPRVQKHSISLCSPLPPRMCQTPEPTSSRSSERWMGSLAEDDEYANRHNDFVPTIKPPPLPSILDELTRPSCPTLSTRGMMERQRELLQRAGALTPHLNDDDTVVMTDDPEEVNRVIAQLSNRNDMIVRL
ncbi:unnamed protein product [Aphanomyces euteiches]|nr:hypothetical protein AeRB84_005802 [Aphanomyces euteiches]